jgi:hypothetical protein
MKNTISACFYHSLGLQRDGKVIGWGFNYPNHLECPDIKIALPYDFLARLNKNVKVLCSIPKYIKMEILEDYTEWTFNNLFNI